MTNVFHGMKSICHRIKLLFDIINYLWHMKTGEWIITNKTIPTSGIFSWSALENNLYWMSHEWLSAIILYLLSFGSNNIAIISFAILGVLGIYCIIIKNKSAFHCNPYITMGYILLCVGVLGQCFYPRPHIISMCLVGALLSVLNK